MTYAVLTSIVSPTRAVEALATRLRHSYWTLIAVGDEKGPDAFPVSDAVFLDIRRQNLLPYKLARLLPRNHYARKNLGYLHAMAAGAKSIYETDDDNEPLASWAPRSESCEASRAVGSGWVNVYRHFTRQRIWPRGLPLDEIGSAPDLEAEPMGVQAPIQQGLANGSPDVDAVWRLTMDQPVTFDERGSVLLPEGAWCPFNSQSTWWWPDAYPLMYLPSHCSFRMTDIWRGLVAQRCLWAMGKGLVFHGAEVFQERNPHDLMRDFKDEVDGYLQNKRIAKILGSLKLPPGSPPAENMRLCYRALVKEAIFPPEETPLVSAWLDDMASFAAR